MKVMLIVLFITTDGWGNAGTKLEYEQPDMATCESVAEHLADIFSVDSALKETRVSINCVQV